MSNYLSILNVMCSVMVNIFSIHLYNLILIIFVISVILIIIVMSWPISVSNISLSPLILSKVGICLTLILSLLIWICIIYSLRCILTSNNPYLLMYYLLNVIYFTINTVSIFCLMYEYQSVPLLLMMNNIIILSIFTNKGISSSNYLLISYSIISGLLLYSSMYLISLSNLSNNLLISISTIVSSWIYLSLFISGCIKLSIFPGHMWLGKVHVEAPTIVSILLAGVSLKTGFYLNYLYISHYNILQHYLLSNIVYILLIGVIINTCVIYYSIDGKRWIALYSIIHMNSYYVILVISRFSLFYRSVLVYGMLGHSIISGGLFLILGYLYDLSGNKIVYMYNNINSYLSTNLFILLLGNSSFPLFVLFIYELLSFIVLSLYSILFSVVFCILSCSNLLSSLFLYVKYLSYNIYNSSQYSGNLVLLILSYSLNVIIFLMGLSLLLPITVLY